MSRHIRRASTAAKQQTTDSGWRNTVTALAVLYEMLEKGTKFNTLFEGEDDKFAEPIINMMFDRDYVALDGSDYVVTKHGRELRDRMVAMYNQALQFEVFGAVVIDAPLDPGMRREDNEALVCDDVDDPRFHDGPQAIDMRLAVMAYIVEQLKDRGRLNGDFNPYVLVFIQKLGEGALAADDFWFRLRSGDMFTEIEAIVDSAYRWRSMDPSSEENAANAMFNLYQAGMAQARKLQGDVCSNCELPLGMYAYYAERDGRKLDACPRCKHRFAPPSAGVPSGDYDCPKCGNTTLCRTDTSCGGCGAVINWRLPEGSVETGMQATDEVVYEPIVVWDGYYGYTPYYYDPIDPFLAGAACALVFDAILD